MAVFTFTQTDKVLGTLTNGMKLVETVVLITSADNGTATPIYIKPLHRVVKFIATTRDLVAVDIMAWAAGTTILNTIEGTPAASLDANVYTILSFGY
jgi:hypothetical protein